MNASLGQAESHDGTSDNGVFHRPEDSSDRQKVLLGHDRQWQEFLHLCQNDGLHGAFLLHGKKGIGKASFALAMAAHLLQRQRDRTSASPFIVPCDSLRRHGDFFLIDTNAETIDRPRATDQIGIDDIRKMREFLALRPAMDGWRVVMIDGADQANRESANGLLKSLEEPPQKCLFLLVAHYPDRLPQTVLSRCRKWAMHPLSESHFSTVFNDLCAGADIAHGTDQKPVDWYRLSGGAPGAAARLIQYKVTDMEELIGRIWTARASAKDVQTLISVITEEKDARKEHWKFLHTTLRRLILVDVQKPLDHHDLLFHLWDDLNRMEKDMEDIYLDYQQSIFTICVLIRRYRQLRARYQA